MRDEAARLWAFPLATMKKCIAILSFALLFAGSVLAKPYEDQFVSLEVPEGFDGPIHGSDGPQTKVVGYAKPYQNRKGGTLFQISEYNMGEALRGMPKDMQGEAADFYLEQFLGGVKRRRTNFLATKPERIVLGGIPAARVKWTGDVAGQRASGVMYCVVIETVIVSFHTQDLEGAPPENRAAAIKAFERVAVRHGG